MKTLKHALGLFLFFCFLIAAFSAPAQAQDDKADEIVSKHLEALGGVDNIKSLHSIKQVGEVTMPMMGMVMPMMVYQERPDKVRSEVEVNANGTEMEIISGFDGTVAWTINPMQGGEVQDLPEDQRGSLDYLSDMDGPLIDYADKGNTIEYVGEEEVDGVNAHKIKLTQADSSESFLFFDTETLLQIKMIGEDLNPMTGAKAQMEMTFSDYREVEGVLRPFHIEIKVDGQVFQQVVLSTVVLNEDFDDALFTRPQ